MEMSSFPPTRRNDRSWRERSSLLCIGWGSSPTSSRKRVPRCAVSKSPFFVCTAPVKAPRTCPNSSLSISVSGMAAQLIGTKGNSFRGLRAWRAAATSSFPVPLSPRIITLASVGATRSISSKTPRIASLRPTIPSYAEVPRTDSRSAFRRPASSSFRARAARTSLRRFALSNGLVR